MRVFVTFFLSFLPLAVAQPTNSPTVDLSTCADPLTTATGAASCHADGFEYAGQGIIIASGQTGGGSEAPDYMFAKLGSTAASSNYPACAAWVEANRSQKDYFGFIGYGTLTNDANGIAYDQIFKNVGTGAAAWIDCVVHGEELAATSGASLRSANHNAENHNCYLAFDYGTTAAGKADFLSRSWQQYSGSSTGSGPPGALAPGSSVSPTWKHAFVYHSGATRRTVGYTYNSSNKICYVFWLHGEAPSGGLSGDGSAKTWTHRKSTVVYTATEALVTGSATSIIYTALNSGTWTTAPTAAATVAPTAASAAPTAAPTPATSAPVTVAPTAVSAAPTAAPTPATSAPVTVAPTALSAAPTAAPTNATSASVSSAIATGIATATIATVVLVLATLA